MFESDYSTVDRLVHRLAMSQLDVQKLVSGIEDRGFDKANPDIRAERPVFLTSLPRAGTTLLLEIFADTPDFATHTYRDMPFLLCPLTWEKISHGFRKRGRQRERAHGDGMLISYDSVEAFEEVIWRAFWRDHFQQKRILPWSATAEDEEGEFKAFLRQHMRKVIWLTRTRKGNTSAHRYISKNNANIARLAWLSQHFPDATVLVPYREPIAHIRSLARQHRNFLDAHEKDPFSLQYMESIGHLEFGKALRPIDFDGWLERSPGLDPLSLGFWAEYWINAFEAVLGFTAANVLIFSYDRLCAEPQDGLKALEQQLGMDADTLSGQASRFRAPTRYSSSSEGIAPDRLERLQAVRSRLDARALF